MPATVPLSTPVRSITAARALAESTALAGFDEATGPALDRILRFLHALPHAALLRDTEGILDVLALLGDRRATHCAGWLSRVAGDGDCAAYWAQLADLAGRAA